MVESLSTTMRSASAMSDHKIAALPGLRGRAARPPVYPLQEAGSFRRVHPYQMLRRRPCSALGALRIPISRFDDGSGRYSGFEVRRRSRNSVQFAPRSKIISIRSGISSPGSFTSRDARLHWRSGAHLPRRAWLASGRVALRVGESHYFDDVGAGDARALRPARLPELERTAYDILRVQAVASNERAAKREQTARAFNACLGTSELKARG
jgi:hypothetical protein